MTGKFARYLIILSAFPLMWGCATSDVPEKESESLNLKLNFSLAFGNAEYSEQSHGNIKIENQILADQLSISLYNADTGLHLITLYDYGNNSNINISQTGQALNCSFLIPSELIAGNPKILAAIFQKPVTPLSGDYLSGNLTENIEKILFGYVREAESAGMWTERSDLSVSMPAFGFCIIDTNSDFSEEKQVEIKLIRALAKVEISAAESVRIEGARIIRTVDNARLLPPLSENLNDYLAEPNVDFSSPIDCELPFIQNSEGNFVAYLPEMSVNQLNSDRAIFDIKVGDRYYPLKFTSYTDGNPDLEAASGYECILRNSYYSFEILGIVDTADGQLLVESLAKPWIKHNYTIPL